MTTGPRPMRQSLEALLDDLGSAPVRATSSLIDRWPEVVGPELAAHTEPVSVRDHTLVVHADDPAYGERLSWDERRLVERLASVLGAGVVTRVQVRTRA